MDERGQPGCLEVVLQRRPEDAFEPDWVSEAPLVRFSAYARRQRLFGWVRLNADRLTDLLNTHDTVALVDAEIEDLEAGGTRSTDRVVIASRDLVAVHAAGPRGDPALRHRTRIQPVAIKIGPYLIGGHLHAAPAVEPLASLLDRPPMVPLTDAWIEYWSGDERRKHSTGTIIVNRLAADWVRVVTDDDLIEGSLRPWPTVSLPSF